MYTRAFDEVRHVAFDFDGTLADTIDAHIYARRQAFVDMADHYQDSRFADISDTVHESAHHHATHTIGIIGWVLQEAGIIDSIQDERVLMVAARKNQIYHEVSHDGLAAIDGMIDVVRAVADNVDGAVSIVTTAPRAEVMPFIQRHGLLDVFSSHKQLITAEDASSRLKPHPKAYEVAVRRAKLTHSPEMLVAIEDTPQGVESARRAGARAIGVLTTRAANDFAVSKKSYRPQRIAEKTEDIIRILTPTRMMHIPEHLR